MRECHKYFVHATLNYVFGRAHAKSQQKEEMLRTKIEIMTKTKLKLMRIDCDRACARSNFLIFKPRGFCFSIFLIEIPMLSISCFIVTVITHRHCQQTSPKLKRKNCSCNSPLHPLYFVLYANNLMDMQRCLRFIHHSQQTTIPLFFPFSKNVAHCKSKKQTNYTYITQKMYASSRKGQIS